MLKLGLHHLDSWGGICSLFIDHEVLHALQTGAKREHILRAAASKPRRKRQKMVAIQPGKWRLIPAGSLEAMRQAEHEVGYFLSGGSENATAVILEITDGDYQLPYSRNVSLPEGMTITKTL